ncbi:MAG: hypothetical protein AB8B71_01865 [Paracoccaceae bacterium]
MHLEDWDNLEEYIATLVVTQGISLSAAVGRACVNNPNATVKSLILATISVATHLGQHETNDAKIRNDMIFDRYKTITSLAADIASLDDRQQLCRDLVTYWHFNRDNEFLYP